ncbi:hypothetical protein BU15DRAFT_75341 [Melanogaster broomeanus]|nr:hypothetical protein BU15DRAFT_75341 [Melanogaster broomeanus]
MPSSQDDDSRDTGVRCTPVVSPKPQVASGRAGEAAADAANPNATSARPTGPAGTSCNPQVEPHEIADSDNEAQGVNEGVERGREKGERAIGRASEKVAAARGPGEGTTDQGADGTSLAAPASSPNNEDTAARGPGKSATDQTADGVSLATPASSPNERGVETSMDETTNETTAPPSLPLEGSGIHPDPEVHKRHAHRPTARRECARRRTLRASRAAQQRAQTERLHNEQQHSNPRRDRRGPGWMRPSQHASQTPSTPLEGERGYYQPSSGHTDDETVAQAHRAQLEDLQGTREQAAQGEKGSWRTIGHADEEVHTSSAPKATHEDDATPSSCVRRPHNANDTGGTRQGPRHAQCEGEQSPAAQVEGEQSPVVQIEPEDDGMPIQRRCEDGWRNEHTRGLQSGLAQLWRRGHTPHDPGSSVRRRSQSRRVEGEMEGQSDGHSNERGGGASGDDGTTSNAGCESRGLMPKMLAQAEDESSQHKNQDQTTRSVPGLPQSPTNNMKRPTTPANPPRRRG